MDLVTRPLISVHSENGTGVLGNVKCPAVFKAPVRADIVRFVHTCMAKNRRQPYAVYVHAGEQTSAVSWGTGRAVARIPRVSGGGTHRAGQGAFGNMCRGGRMFAPTKVWRKWHVKISVDQRRYATCSAIAASAIPSLVLARGHRIESIPEIPLVIGNGIESLTKTSSAVALLKSISAYDDVIKVSNSRSIRAGKGKMRNRRYRQRRGPLVVYKEDHGIVRAFRNLPGVELVSVHSLNLLLLAPGGHLGRFIVWSQNAVEALDDIFGTYRRESLHKSNYKLPMPVMSNPDFLRIIHSDEVQSVIRPAGPKRQRRPFAQKKNPLRNLNVMIRLNPYVQELRKQEILHQEKIAKAKADGTYVKKNTSKERRQRLKKNLARSVSGQEKKAEAE